MPATLEPEVHALYQGKPLCNFTDALPEKWPEGHAWTYITGIEEITCKVCKDKATDLLGKTS